MVSLYLQGESSTTVYHGTVASVDHYYFQNAGFRSCVRNYAFNHVMMPSINGNHDCNCVQNHVIICIVLVMHVQCADDELNSSNEADI